VAVVSRKFSPRLLALISAIAFSAFLAQRSSWADESGASFWQPGTFANLAAVPGPPGWSFNATYFHATLAGGSNVATADVLPLFLRATLRVRLDSDIKTNVESQFSAPLTRSRRRSGEGAWTSSFSCRSVGLGRKSTR
jgi:hypothetical protein